MASGTSSRSSPERNWDCGATEYARSVDTPAGRLRAILSAETLEKHLSPPPLTVLEVGCGLGDLACRLARRGDRVVACDSSAEMIRLATQRASELAEEDRARLDLRLADVLEEIETFPAEGFDCVVAHVVIDYLPEPEAALAQLLPLLARGGVLSLMRVSQASEVLRAVLNRRDLADAQRALSDTTVHAWEFDLSAKSSTMEETSELLRDLGLEVVGTYGIRVFADYLPAADRDDPARWQDLLRLERLCCGVAPYNGMGRYIHIVGIKQ